MTESMQLVGNGPTFDFPLMSLRFVGSHHFPHYDHGPRAELTDLWLKAQIAKEEIAIGRPLTVIETKRVKFDRKRAPPRAMGAIEYPEFNGPSGISWP